VESNEKEEGVMNKQLNEIVEFISDLLLTVEAGAIVIAFWTFLISVFLLRTNYASAPSGFQICACAVLFGIAASLIEKYMWRKKI
jgi:hypothetical protein